MRLARLALLLSTLGLATGCSDPTADYCNQACECLLCNDEAEGLCRSYAAEQRDVASVYACDAAWDAYLECLVTRNACDDGVFQIDAGCQDLSSALEDCIEAASALDD